MIDEQLMAAGRWEIRLRPETPPGVTDQIALAAGLYPTLIVTPGWVDGRAINSARALDAAIYSGVMLRTDERTVLSGASTAIRMGDQDGNGDWEWTWTDTPVSLTDAVAKLVARYLAAITVAVPYRSFASVSTVTQTSAVAWTEGTLRDKLEGICQVWGAEWRCTPDYRVQVGVVADLYGATPRVLLGPNVSGWDPNVFGVRARIAETQTIEQYALDVGVTSNTTTGYSTPAGSSGFFDINGAALRQTVRVDLPQQAAASLVSAAGVAVTQRRRVDTPLSAEADYYALAEILPCGAQAYVHYPDSDLSGSSRVVYHGAAIPAQTLRVVAMTWPVERGMGVYLRRSDAAGTLIDLTEWVQWESGPTRLQVAAIPPRKFDQQLAARAAAEIRRLLVV